MERPSNFRIARVLWDERNTHDRTTRRDAQSVGAHSGFGIGDACGRGRRDEFVRIIRIAMEFGFGHDHGFHGTLLPGRIFARGLQPHAKCLRRLFWRFDRRWWRDDRSFWGLGRRDRWQRGYWNWEGYRLGGHCHHRRHGGRGIRRRIRHNLRRRRFCRRCLGIRGCSRRFRSTRTRRHGYGVCWRIGRRGCHDNCRRSFFRHGLWLRRRFLRASAENAHQCHDRRQAARGAVFSLHILGIPELLHEVKGVYEARALRFAADPVDRLWGILTRATTPCDPYSRWSLQI